MHDADVPKNSITKPGRKIAQMLSAPAFWLVLTACAIGIVLRVWDFGNLPSGLNVDEASIGVEAASLHDFGVDRNGISYPVYFVSWGGGQNVLYAYLLAPLVPLGLSPVVIRLPMLISGCLTLIVVYAIARKLFSPSIAILALFLMAVSPWHIMLSRWALESNLFPFVFSLAFLCLLNIDRNPLWFLGCTALLGLSLYAYATAHFLVPVFLFLTVLYLLRNPLVSRKVVLAGIGLFILTAVPIFLFILINSFRWDAIHLGWITIPRVIAEARFIEMTGFLHGEGLSGYVYGLKTTARILFLHTDDLTYNSLPPFGFLFPGAVVLALVGAFLAAEKFFKNKTLGMGAFGAWLMLAFVLGIIQPPTVHRINILFIPLILCVAFALDWILRDKKFLAIPLALGLGAYSVLFWREYSGEDYRKEIGWGFNQGLIPAIQSVAEYPEKPVCITNEMSMPYIYVQLADFRDPREWLATIRYTDPDVKFRIVEHMGRYSFGIQNCSLDSETIYILKNDQSLPLDETLFSTQRFGDYVVYFPKPVGDPGPDG
jgi:hypothetical protein